MPADYDPSRFYMNASDNKGHSQQVRVHPDTHGRVAILLANPALPYQTYDEFVRDACVHRWQYIAEHYDDPAIQQEARRYVAQAILDGQQSKVTSERKLANSLRIAMSSEGRVYLTDEQLQTALDSIDTPTIRAEVEMLIRGFMR